MATIAYATAHVVVSIVTGLAVMIFGLFMLASCSNPHALHYTNGTPGALLPAGSMFVSIAGYFLSEWLAMKAGVGKHED